MPVGHPFGVPRPSPSGHTVAETTDAAEFLEWAGPVLAAQPVTTTVLATVAATRAASGASPGDGDEARWWVVRDADGEPVGAAGWAGARHLLLSAMPAPAAAVLALTVDTPTRRRLHGPSDTVAAYAAAVPGLRVAPVRTEIVRVLGDLVPPEVPGSMRAETDDDLPLLVEWMAAAAHEMGTAAPSAGREEAVAAVRVRRARTGFRWWVVDGRPRSVASWARRGDLARIGPVYTPPDDRRRGYGSAITAALAAELRADGATVLLHADEANSTSNHIYADLGFHAVDRLQLADLRPSADGTTTEATKKAKAGTSSDDPDSPVHRRTDRSPLG